MPLSAFANTLRSVINLQNKIASSSDLGIKGLGIIDCLALCVLAEEKETACDDMRRRLGIRKPQAERLVAALTKRGFITMSSSNILSLTATGTQTHALLESKWESWIKNNPDGKAALANIRTGVRTMQANMAAN